MLNTAEKKKIAKCNKNKTQGKKNYEKYLTMQPTVCSPTMSSSRLPHPSCDREVWRQEAEHSSGGLEKYRGR